MSRGLKLLIKGDYAGALPPLQREAKRDPNNSFKLGATCDIGVAFLLAGNFAAAQAHFQEIMATAHHSVSDHGIFLGLTYWCRRKWKAAIDTWRAALKAQYGGHSSLDVPFMLFYAAARRPGNASKAEVEELIKSRRERAPPDSEPNCIAAYLLQELDDDGYRAAMKRAPAADDKHVAAIYTARIHFYMGCLARARKDKARFASEMQACNAVRGYEELPFETVVARCEMQFGDRVS